MVKACRRRAANRDGAQALQHAPMSTRVTGVLTFQLVPDGNATVLTLAYRVNGASGSALDKDAPAVDRVLSEQFVRLTRLVETGKPDAP